MADEPTIWISGRLVEKIRAHGAETYPHECCGALLGRDASAVAGSDSNKDALNAEREILELFPLVNRRDDSPHNRFSVTADDVRAAEKAAREHGLDVVGWYHSHPDHPARPSQYDRDHAWPWYSYIIVSVQKGTPLRPYAGKRDSAEFNVRTVGEALGRLTTEFADLRKHLFTEDGKLRSFVNVYVNDEDIRYLAKENTPTKDGDTISIIPSIAGGIEGYNRHCE